MSAWFTRVPSKSNIADNPSRGEITGEMSGPASPIEKGAISCYLAEWFGCVT